MYPYIGIKQGSTVIFTAPSQGFEVDSIETAKGLMISPEESGNEIQTFNESEYAPYDGEVVAGNANE